MARTSTKICASSRQSPAANGSARIRLCRRSNGDLTNNTNIQESALLLAMNKVAKEKELYLENYWIKNKRAIDKGKERPDAMHGSFPPISAAAAKPPMS